MIRHRTVEGKSLLDGDGFALLFERGCEACTQVVGHVRQSFGDADGGVEVALRERDAAA
jgi:hypothetical protein